MPSIDYKENKQVIAELDLLLLEMWFLSNLRNKKIRFNPEPIFNFFNISNKQPPQRKENFVDLHFEIAKKVDALIAKYESELTTNEPQMITKIQSDIPISDIIEKREPSVIRQPEVPVFTSESFQNISFGEFKQQEEFFEIVEPPEFIPVEDDIQENEDNGSSKMFGDQDRSSLKIFSVLGRIKVRNNTTTKQKTIKTEKTKKQPVKTKQSTTQTNGVSIKKEELEKTRNEIEAKKKALKNAKEKEKEKKLELKRQKTEKRKAQKLKKLEMKRLQKEKKLKELNKLKEEKQKEKEKQKTEKLKQQKLKEKEKTEKIKTEKKEEKTKKAKKEKKIKEKQEKTVEMDKFIKTKEKIKSQYDKDVEKLIPIIDGLLEGGGSRVVSQNESENQSIIDYDEIEDEENKDDY